MRIAGFVLALFLMSGAATAGPISSFFGGYEPPPPPVGGDCAAISSVIGPEATWYGEFIGNIVDDFTDYKSPYSARGCFKSESACRVWQYTALNYIGRGELVHMYCRQGIRGY
jgi:hypothetical protein